MTKKLLEINCCGNQLQNKQLLYHPHHPKGSHVKYLMSKHIKSKQQIQLKTKNMEIKHKNGKALTLF